MTTALHVGQRVMTPLGAGTVAGFETFDARGNQGPTALEDDHKGNRVIVRLDDPKAWIATPKTPHPYIFRSQLSHQED